jgi:hypothetical protein
MTADVNIRFGRWYARDVQAELVARENLVTWLSAFAGLEAAAGVCAVVGAWSIARPLARRGVVIALGVGAVLACIWGALSAIPHTRFAPDSPVTIAHRDYLLSLVEEDRVVAAIHHCYENAAGGSAEDGELLREGHRRVILMPLESRASSRIAQALRSLEDYSTAQSSQRSLGLIPLDDPRGLAMTLDCIARFPDLTVALCCSGVERCKHLGWFTYRQFQSCDEELRHLLIDRMPFTEDTWRERASRVIEVIEAEHAKQKKTSLSPPWKSEPAQ